MGLTTSSKNCCFVAPVVRGVLGRGAPKMPCGAFTGHAKPFTVLAGKQVESIQVKIYSYLLVGEREL